MTEHRRKQRTGERQGSPAVPSRKKPDFPERIEEEPTERMSPKKRFVGQDDRLTPEAWKRRFATNLDRMIGLIGLSRVDAAREIGLQHKLVLRLVSAGVSRTDERNIENLTRIANYFALPSVGDFWHADLPKLMLVKGSGFVDKFRPRLLAEREKRLAEDLGNEELALLSRALGFDSAPLTLTGPYAEKVAAILASQKAEQFKKLIDDYFQFTLAIGSDKRHNESS
jgi:hypothetical protein